MVGRKRPDQKLQFEGLRPGRGVVVVCFTLNTGGLSRFFELSVPARLLIEEPILSELDKAARKKLNEAWDCWADGSQPPLPW